jgi:hypothetical protein
MYPAKRAAEPLSCGPLARLHAKLVGPSHAGPAPAPRACGTNVTHAEHAPSPRRARLPLFAI